MEKRKFEFPIVVSDFTEVELYRRAKLHARHFIRSVKPVLARFQLDDDEHLKKHLASESWEDIYRDIVSEREDFLKWSSSEAIYRGEDFWRPFRAIDCKKEFIPLDKEFKFGKLPYCWGSCKSAVVASFVVKNGEITIDERPLHEASIIRPSEHARDLYDLVARFCEELNGTNYTKRTITQLLTNREGKIVPNARGILGMYF